MSRNVHIPAGKLYAQASKGFVEVVIAEKPPVATRSYLRRKYWDGWLGRSMERKIPVISFDSSHVIATMNHKKFGNITGHTLRPGTVWRIPAEFKEAFLEK